MEQLVIGILAHVDAGKTTLSEGLLYRTGAVRKLGRVDHQDAFLDTNHLERERGITIFSKQAVFPLGERKVTLLDTPGHVDFSAEMERTLQVLDCAILVISGTDGVQGHTRTLWRLLERHHIPTFLFVNKMDLPGADRGALLKGLQRGLDGGCLDFDGGLAPLQEELAACDEGLLERYLDGEELTDRDAAGLVARRLVFPCFFGSALRLEGIDRLLEGLRRYTLAPVWPEEFRARVFKVARDGNDRLTYLKVTGGTLRVRDTLSGGGEGGWQEKVSQLRVYSGTKYRTLDEAPAGTVCAVTGLSRTRPGDALGAEPPARAPELEPVLTYQVLLPEGCDPHTMLPNLRQLEEEDPQLRVVWSEALGEIHLQLMGEVQLEVLTRLIRDRFGVEVAFGEGNIVYRETIAAPVEGVGHFEPLRHYAEVHLLLEPLERGAGVVLDTACPEDVLAGNWQRLILTHLAEKTHLGVLTGSPLTDVKITLLTGRAHVKHTEGGDFRQATYRAVRQGLMSARSVLLEPWYTFTLEVPQTCVGRAMTDLQRMSGQFSPPETGREDCILTGTVPVSELTGYHTQVAAYTQGRGRLSCRVDGYRPCHNADEVIAASGYDPERDVDNPADSVFCSHGAGVTVKWNAVRDHMHVDSGWRPEGERASGGQPVPAMPAMSYESHAALEKELMAIFERTYGPLKPRAFRPTSKAPVRKPKPWKGLKRPAGEDYLLVDGYNIIHAWPELRKLAQEDLEGARQRLVHRLRNYQGWKKCRVIVVFDAYKVKGGAGSVERHGDVWVVYTKEAETADMYIEKTTYELKGKGRVRVATSDGLEQLIILGHGAARMSANELEQELLQTEADIRRTIQD